MSEPTSKKNTEDKITLYYWPIRLRGNFLKYILEEAKVKYSVVSDYEKIRAALSDNSAYPVFAVPVLEVGNFRVSQLAAAAQFLAERHGLSPNLPQDKTHALMMFLNLNDIVDELTMSGGHYKMWDVDLWKEFQATRLTKWLKLLESAIIKNPQNQAALKDEAAAPLFFFGKTLSYVDLGCVSVLEGLVDEFGLEKFVSGFKVLYRLYKQVSARESVQKIWRVQKPAGDKSKWVPWCGGQIQASIHKSVNAL
eukprot:gb/GEZN01007452.1/.p1 GENE.gb/GEZN01007452.1/~~gb/GEZN01007452.1/.p1  ORF type:complete len:252 (+),score=48.19 gb/GEZN01007452.1/:53-808(+)